MHLVGTGCKALESIIVDFDEERWFLVGKKLLSALEHFHFSTLGVYLDQRQGRI
jgi:hypothetical protein